MSLATSAHHSSETPVAGLAYFHVHCTAAPYRLYRPQEKDEYVTSIVDDMGRLGLRFDGITYTSDYFPQLKDCGERLIRAGACARLV